MVTDIRSPAPNYGYQWDGVLFMLNNPRCLLLDEPGLGKTVQVLGMMGVLYDLDELRKVIVAVEGHDLGRQWVAEIVARLPEVPVYQAVEPKELLAFLDAPGPAILVASYGMINSRLGTFTHGPVPSLVVLDEISVLKGIGSEHEAARKLSRHSERVVGLTATPLENDGIDVWAILDAVGVPDLWSLDEHEEKFIEWQEGYVNSYGRSIPPKAVGLSPAALPQLRDKLTSHSLRRKTGDVGLELPDRVGPQVIYVKPTSAQLKALQSAEAVDGLARTLAFDKAGAFADGESALATAAIRLLIDNPGTKDVVYAERLELLDIIQGLLEDSGITFVRIQGENNTKERKNALDQFNNNPEIQVLLGSKVLERGLNLQVSN